jgi:putative transposase
MPPLRDSKNRAFYLPRLAPEYYQADAAVLWTLATAHRKTGWHNPDFHSRFRELLIHTSVRESLLCPAYVLMPDHVHLIWLGCKLDSDQRNAMAFLRSYIKSSLALPLQHQSHDHVFKADERKRNAFAAACEYVLLNPVRANLAAKVEDWPYSGAIIPGYPSLNPAQPEFWPTFWKIHEKQRDPACTQRMLPPIQSSWQPR